MLYSLADPGSQARLIRLHHSYSIFSAMKLVGSLSSPYVRKVRIVMAEKKLDYELEIENVWSADTRIQDTNPLGKVPCLVMEDAGAVFDSRVIVEYLDTITPVGRLLPASGRERAEVKCWEALADGVLDAALLIRAEFTQRPEELRSETWMARQRGKIDAALDAMSHGLAEKPFCAGNSYTLADVATGCALAYLEFRFPEIDWRSRHANLGRLLDKLSLRPSFIDTVPVG
jgi:glutathione S-transferase